MKIIAAFSSDSREQYKADIFKTLSLQNGDTVHFRYKKKYIDPQIYQQRKSMIGNDVYIFFTQNNNDGNDDLIHKSIRRAKIIAFDWSEMTELYHVRMILDDFIDAKIVNAGDKSRFLKYIECSEEDKYSNWKSRIEDVRKSFPDLIFFNIDGIYNSKGIAVKPKYNHQSKGCYYEVYHGERYTLNIRIANPNDSKYKLLLNSTPDDVVIAHCNPVESSVQYDDIFVPLNIKTVPFFKHSNFLTYQITNKKNELPIKNESFDDTPPSIDKGFDLYTVSQELCLKLNLKNAAGFGFLCVLAFLALTFAGDKTPVAAAAWPYVKVIFSSVLIFLSTTGLFYFFNKK